MTDEENGKDIARLDERSKGHGTRLDKIEESLKWVYRSLVGLAVALIAKGLDRFLGGGGD